jgi:hypothetical protein
VDHPSLWLCHATNSLVQDLFGKPCSYSVGEEIRRILSNLLLGETLGIGDCGGGGGIQLKSVLGMFAMIMGGI